MNRPYSRRVRAGFTLVELLVVIAIIAVLAGLISAGALVAYRQWLSSKNAMEINQLVVAMEAFKAQYKCYPPSRVRLLNSGAYDMSKNGNQPNNPLDFESKTFLLRIWPHLQWQSVDWTGTGNPNSDNGQGWILEGDQCLVFFLGGIPSASPAGVMGFSTSATNPTFPGGTRVGPFYTNFLSARLVQVHAGNPFYSFNDAYGTAGKPSPFAYFATLKQPNMYNPYYAFPYGANVGAAPVSDCATIGAMPYYGPTVNTTTQYQNSGSYQIISAGADQIFGSTVANGGVIWSSTSQGATFNLTSAGNPAPAQPFGGMDDRTNFCPNILSAGGAQ